MNPTLPTSTSRASGAGGGDAGEVRAVSAGADAPSTGTPSTGTVSTVGTGNAHAKAILFGEHAVVYGAPAIAVPVPELRAEVEATRTIRGVHIESDLFTGPADDAPARLGPVVTATRAALERTGAAGGVSVRIHSDIPYERGLGSSAAVAAAIARAITNALGAPLDAQACYEIVQRAERVAHGNPSGLDARAVVSDGAIRFDRGAVTPVRTGAPFVFVLADSGIEGSTAHAVATVRESRTAHPAAAAEVFTRLASLAEEAATCLTAGDGAGIGARMREAHCLLDWLGVSTPDLDALVAAAQGAGSAGAKLTGGGMGGCVLALADSFEHADRLGAAMCAAGAPRVWTTTVGSV